MSFLSLCLELGPAGWVNMVSPAESIAPCRAAVTGGRSKGLQGQQGQAALDVLQEEVGKRAG